MLFPLAFVVWNHLYNEGMNALQRKQEKMETELARKAQEEEDKEMQHCTFTPAIKRVHTPSTTQDVFTRLSQPKKKEGYSEIYR